METKTIECQECLGTGKIEKLICTKPVSECCGGCYKYKECPNCDGEGEIEVEIDEIYLKLPTRICKRNNKWK